jgi:hypothetical protein
MEIPIATKDDQFDNLTSTLQNYEVNDTISEVPENEINDSRISKWNRYLQQLKKIVVYKKGRFTEEQGQNLKASFTIGTV